MGVAKVFFRENLAKTFPQHESHKLLFFLFSTPMSKFREEVSNLPNVTLTDFLVKVHLLQLFFPSTKAAVQLKETRKFFSIFA